MVIKCQTFASHSFSLVLVVHDSKWNILVFWSLIEKKHGIYRHKDICNFWSKLRRALFTIYITWTK